MGAAIDPFLKSINEAIVNPIIALLFTVALVVFIWGIVKMIANSENEAERSTGRRNMLYGVIGMLIMVSSFFIMQMIVDTFELNVDGINPIESITS